MEFLDQIWQSVSEYIDISYLVVFMMFSYLVKSNFQDLLDKITGVKWKSVYTVLIIATVIAVPFFLFTEDRWEKLLVSYSIGTSLHELIFGWIEDKFNR
jgi:hypothetical protein